MGREEYFIISVSYTHQMCIRDSSSTLKVDRKGLSIGTVEKAQFNDYVSVDGQVVPISVVPVSYTHLGCSPCPS